MDQRVSFITLVVTDLDATRRFYVDGLGWEPAVHVAGEVLMFRVAEKVVLSMWAEAGFVDEVGHAPARGGVPPITLSHNLATTQGVDTVLEQARIAGATQVGEGVQRDWGGYSGYFADPDGFRWEVACNPQEIGQSVLP
jgi:catechol 2,3-dioxygenase-like lactoylglutathione lyase family enzyme